MVKPIQQIKRDLAATEDSSKLLALEIHALYVKYLTKLSEYSSQQLMIASYQICTQKFPESFLKLSFNQRQKLQQELRDIGKKNQILFINSLSVSNLIEPSENQLNSETLPPEPAPEENLLVLSEEQSQAFLNPNQLFKWTELIETQIHKILEEMSTSGNICLQNSEIIPPKIPMKFIEMAIKAQENSLNITVSSPNILNLMIDKSPEEQNEIFTPVAVSAICLRRSDLEFADQDLSMERNKINNLIVKINQLQKKYNIYQRELTVAQAEAAWRASWFQS